MRLTKVLLTFMLVSYGSNAAFAETKYRLFKVQTHSGRLDHDGILSPGEIPNRNIDYDRAQRDYRWRGDSRVENPDNDAAAYQDRSDRRGQLRYDWQSEGNGRLRRESEYRNRERSWWNWW